MKWSRVLAAACVVFVMVSALSGQAHHVKSEVEAAGDTPANPPALAHLSGAFKSKDIKAAMRKVGDWEMKKSREDFNQDWTYAALYAGYMAAAKSLPEPSYEKAMLAMGNKFNWKLGPRLAHADDQAIGQTYLELYKDHHEPRMIEPTEKQFDALMKTKDDPKKPLWWWCDALFMAPPVWARLSSATGNKAYLDYMDHEWWITSDLLYDQDEHLYFRDESYLDKHEPNGKPLFWSRGNGWVMAGLARVLDAMPKDYPTRQKYVDQYKEMAARVVSIQSPDGLWRPGLLDPDAYPLPENSGSGFFVYALAWGIDRGILPRAAYLPAVKKGWAGLVSHIYVDGRLGCIQPIGAAPGDYKPASSYVYGVGAFLLAGSEVERLAEKGSSDGGVEILSTVRGVDFGPYLKKWKSVTDKTWLRLMPDEAKRPTLAKGEVVIRFKILPSGKVDPQSVVLDTRSGDETLDRAAWRAIVDSKYPKLPKKFKGPYLGLRVRFLYNAH